MLPNIFAELKGKEHSSLNSDDYRYRSHYWDYTIVYVIQQRVVPDESFAPAIPRAYHPRPAIFCR